VTAAPSPKEHCWPTGGRVPLGRMRQSGARSRGDADPDDLKTVKRANPAPWITLAALREQQARCTPLAWRQFHACRWYEGAAQWLPHGAWDACRDDYEVEPGESVWLGVDIGGSRAASAVVAITDDLRIAAVHVLQGDDSVLAATAAIRELAAHFTIREVAYDPWRYHSEPLRLADDGLPVVEFPQESRADDGRLGTPARRAAGSGSSASFAVHPSRRCARLRLRSIDSRGVRPPPGVALFSCCPTDSRSFRGQSIDRGGRVDVLPVWKVRGVWIFNFADARAAARAMGARPVQLVVRSLRAPIRVGRRPLRPRARRRRRTPRQTRGPDDDPDPEPLGAEGHRAGSAT
jgi:hypothetical protein